MLSFETTGEKTGYPQASFDSQTDQSYGFQPAYKLQSGSTRGAQIVGNGGTVIDGNNNRITITNPTNNTSLGMGAIPGSTTNEFGFFSLDASGNVVMKIVNGTMYVYDIINNKNVMQTGKLPDSSYGWAVAATGFNVSDGVS